LSVKTGYPVAIILGLALCPNLLAGKVVRVVPAYEVNAFAWSSFVGQ
jgi:hypothetical protein